FEVRPKITVTGYKGLKVPRREVEVKEADVLAAVDDLRERAARYEGVEGRGVELGDHVLVDIGGRAEGVDEPPFRHEDAFFEVGSAGPHPELSDELKGLKPGEEKSFGVRYPQDHPAQGLAGRRVVYDVKLKEIKTKHLPGFDEEFLKTIGATGTNQAFAYPAPHDSSGS